MKRLILMSLFITLSSYAFQFTQDLQNGFYWRGFPIGMSKLVTDPSQGPLLNDLTNRAVAEWENAIGADIWDVGTGFQVTGSFSGNYIRWSFNFEAETGYDGQNTLGVTTRYVQGTHVVRTDIILNGNNPVLLANRNGELYVTILHEFGHTIGLGHSFAPAVMQASLGWYRSLTVDDRDGGIAAYEEHLEKQRIGFVSPLVTDEFTDSDALNFLGCGTISSLPAPPNNGMGAFALTILLSLIMFLSAGLARPRRVLATA